MILKKLLKKTSNFKDIIIPQSWKNLYGIGNNEDFADFLKVSLEKIENFKITKKNNNNMLQLFLQHFTSYKHNNVKEFDNGNLIKSICMLPFIAECGFNSIMLLPNFMRSEIFRKGTKGSPYSVKDYYKIDSCLNDNYSKMTENELFKAFIQASHKCGIKVFIDMVPRTAARDSLWILENPDWFYWIKPKNTNKLVKLLQTPIDGLESSVSMTKDVIDKVLQGLPIKEISELFEFSPKRQNEKKWNDFVKKHGDNEDFLDEIVKEFGIITPPCTSDCVNDPQPAWTDVTPLRLFNDYCDEIIQFSGKEILQKPPFFIQAVLKSSNFPGQSPINDLWEKICQIPLYYNNEYKVDGLRGDMFHALPSDMIDKMVKDLPKDFVLIMENLDNKAGDELSIEHNFDYYTGNLFTVIDEKAESLKYFLNQTNKLKTKILTMPVIGDSVPIFAKNREKAMFQIALSALFPNSCFGLTADTLIANKLPLNYGLGFTEEAQKDFDIKLKKHKRSLAYFNYDTLTYEWDNIDYNVLNHIKTINKLRDEIFANDMKLGICTAENDLLYFELCHDKKVKYKIYANLGEYKEFDVNERIIYSYQNTNENKFAGKNNSLIVCEVKE
ncbi:MAG: alpha-amylase family glycosyl hydrolase [Candidatus Muirbacterium halophilum]|nr:alpha-amylase family glycosyl hydrolase [Candidatus Muirbacterium halophilum]MCK9475659.1 alpha-amylase family glycosyl hydrolase [Candidatus Muirbacterium halophilum]